MNMKLGRFKNCLKIGGYVLASAHVLILGYIIMQAYFNNYNLLITLNSYGEAHLDVAMLLFVSPVVFLGCVLEIKDFLKNSRNH
ncbi:MAG TPA: hypothetical protein ENI42_01050 [Thermoplasmatales archaeon]|nr:hypothetical protein [Thermoplasmatales archaeon]